ncbi:hypothetical protein V8B55DRAFT_1503950 [Mucor lusitanicus]
MSYITQEATDHIFSLIKDDDSTEILWSCFVSEAKHFIINSWDKFPKNDACRAYWLRFYHNQVAKLGCVANTGYDNWFTIQKLVNSITNQSTVPLQTIPSSASMPASASMPPPPKSCSLKSVTTSSSNSATSSSKSKLGTLLSNQNRQIALDLYNQMEDTNKWKLTSGRFVEDVMHSVLLSQPFEHPSQYCILDIDDDNWIDIFTPEERREITLAIPPIELPSMPSDMVNFLIDIPDTEDLTVIYNHLENTPLDYNSQNHLLWLKHSIQNAIDVWKFVNDAFRCSKLTAKQQISSTASKEAVCKKRKIAMTEPIQRQKHALVPDISILYGSQTYAIIEAAKTENDTKQLVEIFKKCPEFMSEILNQLIKENPTEQREIKVYASVLSKATCCCLMLSNPFGYVKVVSRSKKLAHPEVKDAFKPDMCTLLDHFWGFKLAIEAVVDSLSKSKYENSPFKQK